MNRMQIIEQFIESYKDTADVDEYPLYPLEAPVDVSQVCIYTPIGGTSAPIYRGSVTNTIVEIQLDIYSIDYLEIQSVFTNLESMYNNKTQLGDIEVLKVAVEDITDSIDNGTFRISFSLFITF